MQARWIIIFLLFILQSGINAQVSYNWAKTLNGVGTGNDSGMGIDEDGVGNIYIAGYFSGSMDFDPGAGTTTLTSAGNRDIFICKYDVNGSLIWAKSVGGTGEDLAFALDVDANGNSYLTGYFVGTVDFDPNAGTTNLTTFNSTIGETFVLKLNDNGNLTWAKQFIKTTSGLLDQGYGITLDATGNVLISGIFSGTVDFNPGAGTNTLSSPAVGTRNGFIAKLDNSGNYVSAIEMESTTGAGDCYVFDIDTDANSDVYVTGQFTSTTDFNPTNSTNSLTTVGASDIFVAKYTSSLVYSWAKGIGSNSTTGDRGNGIEVNSGYVWVTGHFTGMADFDPGAGITYLIAGATSTDIFALKLTDAGIFEWAVQAGAANNDYGYDVDVDASGNMIVCGTFMSTVDFDPSTTTSQNLISNANSEDIFIWSLDSNGNKVFASSIGGASPDYPAEIYVNFSNEIFYTGYFQGTVDFDPTSNSDNQTSTGNRDAYFSKWNFCVSPSTPGAISGLTTPCAGTSQTYFISAVGSASSYNWTLPAGWTGTSTSNSITVIVGSSGGFLEVSAVNGCGSSANSQLLTNVFDLPAAPTSITGPDTVCSNQYNVYSATHIGGATSFTWTFPSGWTGYNSTMSTSVTSGNMGGTISVTANNSCGSSSPISMTVSLTPALVTPTINIIDTLLCMGSPITFVANSPGANYFQWTIPSGWTGSSTDDTLIATPNVSGPGQVISLTSYNACSGSPSTFINFYVNGLPDVTVTTQLATLILDSIADSYQWIDCNNNYLPVNGETLEYFNPVANGDYAVIVSENGCLDTSSCYAITTVGENEYFKNELIKLYPNPADQYIEFENSFVGEVYIMDIAGKIIQTIQKVNYTARIETSLLPSGTYFVKLENNTEVFISKFNIQH